MINPPSLIGLAGCGLLPASVVVSTVKLGRFPSKVRGLILLAMLVLALVPIRGLPLAGYVRGLTGDISITTWILLVGASVSHVTDRELYSARSKRVLMFLVLAGGVFLYPMALGLTYFDPYTLGYGSRPFLVVLFVFALWAVRKELSLIALCLSASVLAHLMGLLESRNLWDYLIDPWLVLYATGFLFWWWRTRLRRRKPPQS